MSKTVYADADICACTGTCIGVWCVLAGYAVKLDLTEMSSLNRGKGFCQMPFSKVLKVREEIFASRKRVGPRPAFKNVRKLSEVSANKDGVDL